MQLNTVRKKSLAPARQDSSQNLWKNPGQVISRNRKIIKPLRVLLLGNNSSKTSNCAKVKSVVYPIIKVKTITVLIANSFYNVAELDPHRHIKQTAEELAEIAEKVRNEIKRVET